MCRNLNRNDGVEDVVPDFAYELYQLKFSQVEKT